MAKEIWKAGNMLYPVPAVLVSCQNKAGESNMLTIAWTGTVCSDPHALYFSTKKSCLSCDAYGNGRICGESPDRRNGKRTGYGGSSFRKKRQ